MKEPAQAILKLNLERLVQHMVAARIDQSEIDEVLDRVITDRAEEVAANEYARLSDILLRSGVSTKRRTAW